MDQKTWRVFERAVKQEFSARQIEAFSGRYGFNFAQMAKSGLPLERRYVEYFGVGAACPYTYYLKQDLRGLTPSEIHARVVEATKNAYLGRVEDPTKISGARVQHTHQQFVPDYFNADQARASLHRGIGELTSKDPNVPRLHPFYSRLGMALINFLETEEGRQTLGALIPAPGARDGGVDYYEVHKIISKGGLNAIFLRPVSDRSTLKPIVCFRCTKQTLAQHEALESNFENFNKHIGEAGYAACRGELARALADPKFTRGEKVTVTCYSQGGAYAAYFLRDHWRQIWEFVGFNPVAADAKVVKALANEINASDARFVPPAIYHHLNDGDWAPRVGGLHIGYGITHPNAQRFVYQWSIHDHPAPSNNVWDPVQVSRWLNLHGVRPMDTEREDEPKSRWNKEWKYSYGLYIGSTQVDQILDAYAQDRVLENLRYNIGYKIVYKLAVQIVVWIGFLLRLFNIRFMRR